MELPLRILIGLLCIPLTALGIRSMFVPKSMGEAQAIAPDGAAGLNTIRGLIGGFFLGCVAMLVLGLTTGDTLWFLSVAILMGIIAIGRLVGIGVDGFDKAVAPPLLVELVIVGVLIAGHLTLAGA